MNEYNYTQNSVKALQTAEAMAQENSNNFIMPEHLLYALYDGKFVRSIAAPDRDCTTDELASALSEYIKLFDKLMKAYLAGHLDDHDVEAAYFSQMRNSPVHI